MKQYSKMFTKRRKPKLGKSSAKSVTDPNTDKKKVVIPFRIVRTIEGIPNNGFWFYGDRMARKEAIQSYVKKFGKYPKQMVYCEPKGIWCMVVPGFEVL